MLCGLDFETVQPCTWTPTFRGDLVPPIAVEMMEHIPQKQRYLPTRLHVVATETIII